MNKFFDCHTEQGEESSFDNKVYLLIVLKKEVTHIE